MNPDTWRMPGQRVLVNRMIYHYRCVHRGDIIVFQKYVPVICARLAMTMVSAATMTQPVTQPARDPMASTTQLKVVPQSGSAVFR